MPIKKDNGIKFSRKINKRPDKWINCLKNSF